MKISMQLAIGCVLLCAPMLVLADITVPVTAPIGVAADANRVLITHPFCGPKEIVNIKSGTAVTWFTLPDPDALCQEVYIAISPGLGGFTAGDVFFTYHDKVYKIVEGVVRTAVVFATPGLTGGSHAGILFDRVGTFGYNMIVSSPSGVVFVIDHNGSTLKTFTPAVAPGIYALEQPNVAPLDFGPYGGYLWLTDETGMKIYAMSPITGAVTALPATFTGNNSPESIHFLGPSVCSVDIAGTAFSYVDALYGTDTVGLFDVTAHPNTALLNEEFSGDVHFLNLLGDFGATFRIGLPQQEQAAIVSCPVATGCTLTQGGYKNHFNSKLTNFPPGGLTLGTVFYTNAQLDAILQNNAVKGNGLISLAHQLITAQLNIFYGAQPPSEVALAIVQANVLIGGKIVPPLAGSGFLSPSTSSTLVTILDNFNEGRSGPPHCSE